MTMPFTEQMSEALSIPVASLPPANRGNNATAYTVGPVPMKYFRRLMAHVSIGAIVANTNVSAYFQGSNSSNTGFANISSNNQVVFFDTANTEATLEIRADQLPTGNQYVQLALLVGGDNTAAFSQATLLGGCSRYSPAADYDVDANTLIERFVAPTE